MRENNDSKIKISTSTFIGKLFSTTRLKAFMKTYDDMFVRITFHEYIQRLCRERGLIPEQVIKSCGVDRTYGHQL